MYFLPSKNAEPEEIPDGDEIVLQKGQENGIRCQVHKKTFVEKIAHEHADLERDRRFP